MGDVETESGILCAECRVPSLVLASIGSCAVGGIASGNPAHGIRCCFACSSTAASDHKVSHVLLLSDVSKETKNVRKAAKELVDSMITNRPKHLTMDPFLQFVYGVLETLSREDLTLSW